MFRPNVRKFRWKSIVKKLIYLKHFANLWKVWPCSYLENKISVIQKLHFQKKSFLGFHTKKIRFLFHFKYSTRINQENWHSTIFCSDHSPIFTTYKNSQDIFLGKYFWKFNNSLIQDDKYLYEMKEHIKFFWYVSLPYDSLPYVSLPYDIQKQKPEKHVTKLKYWKQTYEPLYRT